MATIDDVRALASALPRAYEVLVHDRVKFRVGSIVFAAFSRDERIMGFAFPKEERDALVASEPDKFLMPEGSDMRWSWVLVRMDAVDAAEVRELVLDAWRMIVPKSVAASYEPPQPLPDVLAPRLEIVFVGINPGLRSAGVGHHFAGAGNRFWRVLHLAGLTPAMLRPEQDRELLSMGIGLTNIVDRPSSMAHELSLGELREGATAIEAKLRRFDPELAVFLGLGAYRRAFRRPRAAIGVQPETIGRTRVAVVPNPSGAQARYPPAEVAAMLREITRGCSSVDTRSPDR